MTQVFKDERIDDHKLHVLLLLSHRDRSLSNTYDEI